MMVELGGVELKKPGEGFEEIKVGERSEVLEGKHVVYFSNARELLTFLEHLDNETYDEEE